MSKKFHRLAITAPEKDYDAITGLLALRVNFGWRELSLPTGETIFTIHCEDPEFLATLRETLAPLDREIIFEHGEEIQEDWLNSWRDFFTPVYCGSRFVIIPPWLAGEEYGDHQKIIINPKSAFGTGHHATTSLCLAALSDLLDEGKIKPGQNFLDLGCGTGVLGIGSCLSGLTGIGLDIDPLAVTNAMENLALNAISSLDIRQGSIKDVENRKFSLIMANILSAPLIEMSASIVAALNPGGIIILSGILDIQADKVDAAFQSLGLPPASRKSDGEWRALVYA